MENILRGQQAELQALPRAVTRNTERWIHSRRGCWDPKQQGKTPQRTAVASAAALSQSGWQLLRQRCHGPGTAQLLAAPVCVCCIPEADR